MTTANPKEQAFFGWVGEHKSYNSYGKSMNKTPLRSIFAILLSMGFVSILLIRPITLPPNIGTGDLRPYWSSSYLFAKGQDFGDFSKMDAVERNLTGWTEPYIMVAWFSPIGNLIFLPYTLLTFAQATLYWLLTNLVVMFLSVLLIWRNIVERPWIPLIATFGFSMTLVSLFMGQVNTVEVLGLALFLYFIGSKRYYAAGISLVLTTIKPHLVILTLPLLLLDIVRHKQWRVFAGFASALIGCLLILFAFYSAWPLSFWKVVTSGMDTVRATPSLNGLLVVAGEHVWGKWVWLAVLSLAILIWWKRGRNWDQRTLVDVSILVGLIVSPIGWSYDQVMLLLPLLSVFEWMVNGSLTKQDAIVITVALILADALSFYERVLQLGEVWYFWIPLAVTGLYGFAWRRRQAKALPDEKQISLSRQS